MEQKSSEILSRQKTHKSRLSKENKDVTVRLYYDERGLDRYFGLLELGELGGLWKNVAGRYEIDGKKVYAKAIYKDPEQYFKAEDMEKLDVIAKVSSLMVRLNEFVRVYDDVLSKESCETLIKIFDDNSDKHEIDQAKKPSFTQFNLTETLLNIKTYIIF